MKIVHGLAASGVLLVCLCSFARSQDGRAANPNAWMHTNYGVSHAQDDPVPFLCLWDLYCTRHRAYCEDHCQHQYLAVEAMNSSGHACQHGGCSGHGRRHSFSTISVQKKHSYVQSHGRDSIPQPVQPPAYNDSPTQQAAPVAPVDVAPSPAVPVTPYVEQAEPRSLPRNELPPNVIPSASVPTPTTWVSWRDK